MTTIGTTLGSWVEVTTEDRRHGGAVVVAVNRRDGVATNLTEHEHRSLTRGEPCTAELAEHLRLGGFLADHPAPPNAPRRSRTLGFLRTFDTSWAGADRLVGWLYRRGLHRAWATRWIAAQVVLALAGGVAVIAALGSGQSLELRLSVSQVPAYIALSLAAIAVHELAHGLVIVHGGRRVGALGFRLHLGSPAFYVDSVDALLLPRRQRLLQAAAGVWAEWQFTAVIALALWIGPDGAWTPVVYRFVVLNVATIWINLLPFAGLDGSLLLADLVRQPNLSRDSKDAVRRVIDDRQPGDAMLVAYAVVNGVVSFALLLSAIWFWYLLFGAVVSDLATRGPLGWLAAFAVVVISFGPALIGVVPWLRRCTPIDRVAFRCERRLRVRFTEQFATVAPFDRLDERGLGILAGQLHLRRISRSRPLHEPQFEGHLVVDRDVDLHTGSVAIADTVTPVAGPGVAATVRRRFAPTRVALLPHSSAAILAAHAAPVIQVAPSPTVLT